MQTSRFTTGTRKYFLVVIILIAAVFIMGIISQSLIDTKRIHWGENLDASLKEIESTSSKLYKQKQNELLTGTAQLTARVRDLSSLSESNDTGIMQLIATNKNDGFFVEAIKDKRTLLAWKTDAPVSVKNLQALSYTPNEPFFYESPLTTYLCVYDTVNIANSNYVILVGSPFEKHYQNSRVQKEENSFSLLLENIFSTEVQIDYNPYKTKSVDGRYYSFELQNDKNNKIALITIKKPSLRNELLSFSKSIGNIQSICIIVAFLFLGLTVRHDYNKLKSAFIRTSLLLFYLAALRWLMYKLNIPASFASDELTNPTNFASQFGGGIVKSPIEFFITAIFAFAGSIRILLSIEKNFKGFSWRIKNSRAIKAIVFIAYAFILLLSIRGFAASIKSVIFDSSLRYFNEPNLIPDTTHFIMNFATLIASIAIILLMLVIHRLIVRGEVGTTLRQNYSVFALQMFTLLILGYAFIHVQNSPLLTFPLLVAIIVFIQVLFFLYDTVNMKFIYFLLLTGLFSSVISISLLNYFNTQLEKESIKTTVAEINRPKKEFLQFLISEALLKSENESSIIASFNRKDINYHAAAFALWNQTSLKQESVHSSINFLDRSRTVVGAFDAGISIPQTLIDLLFYTPVQEMRIVDIPGETTSRNEAAGIIPVKDDDILLGYIIVRVVSEPRLLIENTLPDIVRGGSVYINNILNPEDLNIVVIAKGELEYAFGDFYPNKDQLQQLSNAAYNGNEEWMNFDFNGEQYIVYAQQGASESNSSITAVALKERKLEWSFFNFFKLFIIHTVILLAFYILIAGYNYYRERVIPLSFRGQLLLGFLLVSIIPIIALAIFNRSSTNDKTKLSIKATLIEKINTVEKTMTGKIAHGMDLQKAIYDASKETNIQCTLFDKSVLLYSTEAVMYGTTILPAYLNTTADLNINYAGLKEFFLEDKLESYPFFTIYKSVSLGGKQYILAANTLTNDIPGIFSPLDVDVFLFGMYSLAILIIIGISSLLANKIAYPIKKLTLATRAVAHGDFNVKLENKEMGELKELFNGFNSMTEELAKSQAELANMEREAAWKEFARQVAHEIKNPLTPMKLTLQQLMAAYKDKSPQFDTIFNKVSSTILHQIETLNSIASEFSQFARMPALSIEKISILPLIQDVVVLFQNEKIKIGISLPENEEYIIQGDVAQLRRMIINFIRNSMQAQSAHVELALSKESGKISLLVSDDGKGISPEHQDKIFESNFTTKKSGMGLGLKLAKRFIENIGGSISLEKGREKGAAFRITFPEV